MANLATTATESLQCIACAIRQRKKRMIEVEDITEYLTNVKEEGSNGSSNSPVDIRIRIPNNAVPFLMRWYEAGTEMSEMLESEYSPSKFKTKEEQEEYDDMMDTLELREKKGTDYAAWANSSVWIANRLAATGYIKSSKTYTFLHADQPIKDGGTDIKSAAMVLLKRCRDNAVDPTFNTAIQLMARGSGDKWNPADIFAIEENKRSIIGSDLDKFLSATQPNPSMGPEIKTMREANDELKEMTKGAKGPAAKNIELIEDMGELYEFNQYVDNLANKFECIPISLKKAQNGFPPIQLMRHKASRGVKTAINLEVKITKIDYKPTADKAIVEFSVGGKTGANLDFRGFETTSNIENVQAQIQAAGSSASHGKIALPLYSFIVKESGGMAAIRAQQRVKKILFGTDIPSARDTVFTPASIFVDYANKKGIQKSAERFNRRTLIDDTPAWAQYIQWLTKGALPSEKNVANTEVVRNVRQKLGDPTGSTEAQMPKGKIGGQKKVVFAGQKKELMREWKRDSEGNLIQETPKTVYKGKPQDFVWAAKYIKNKVQSAEAVFVVDLARKAPKKEIKEAILKAAYSYAASKGLRIFNNNSVKEFMSASTYVKIGG